MHLSCLALGVLSLSLAASATEHRVQDAALGDIESDAKAWLAELKQFTATVGAEAKFFKKLDEEMESPALEHSMKLVGCIAGLVGGFLGDSKKEYVKEIAAIQKALDEAITRIQEQLEGLIESIQEDFLKVFLAPKVERLRSSVEFLTEFSQADDKSGAARQTFEDQMDPISDSIDAWNGVADCFLGEESSCPSNMLDIILQDSQMWPRPAVLVQFSGFHYNILSSGATAICAYQNMTGAPCSLDLKKLQSVAQKIQDKHASMESDYRGSLGGDTAPAVIKAIVSNHANAGYDGSKAIRDAIQSELDTFYFTDGLDSFFGARQRALIVQNQGVNAAWQATGWLKHYQGYDVVYMFSNSSDAGVAVSDSDCTSGDADAQRDCLTGTMGAWDALAYDDTSGTEFWAGSFLGTYWHDRSGDGSCCQLHVASPGYAADSSVSFVGEGQLSSVQASRRQGGEVQALELAKVSHEGNTNLGDPSPSDVMNDISNILSTAGAIADFFGPEGEVVGLALDFVSCIFSLIGGLLGMNQPDPVIEALRNMEKDLMGRLTAVSDQVTQAKSTLDKGAAANVLNNAELPLKDLLDAWNTLYPNGNNSDAVQAFGASVRPISKHINAWNLLRDCLTGANIDCVFDDRGVLDILLTDGQDWMRPLVLTQTVKYYYLLLQKSAVAICGYGRVVDGDSREDCPLLPGLKDDFQTISKSLQKSVTGMKSIWDSQLGADKAPSVIQINTDKHANAGYDGSKAIRDAIGNELDTFYFADGLDSFFGARQSGVVVFDAEKNAAWQATGWLKHYQGYNVVYMFSNSSDAGVAVSDSDCTSGNADSQRDCLTGTKGAWTALAYDDTSGTEFWAGHFIGTYWHDRSGEGSCCELHVVCPGYSASGLSVRAESGMRSVQGSKHKGEMKAAVTVARAEKEVVNKRSASHRSEDCHGACVGSDQHSDPDTLII